MITDADTSPTPDNSTPWNDESGGRGSMVWFTQATMLQSAELAFASIRRAREEEKKVQAISPRKEPYFATSFDTSEAFERGIFPSLPLLSGEDGKP